MSDPNSSPEDDSASGVEVRLAAGLGEGDGPTPRAVSRAVAGFADRFDHWFTRVIRQAVPKYRTLVVQRINPLIRPIEFEGLSAAEVATRLVTDYVNRNFVTAGGWAIEEMAIALAGAGGGAKASSRGIDLERTDAAGNRHLYVLKSGKVTRNSDILSKLKQHARDAEKLIRQGGTKVAVFANYVVSAGATTSTFADGINRPSSGEFWAEVTGLEQSKALALVSEVAKAAGRQVTRDSDPHIEALTTLVRAYVADPAAPEQVDWPFIFKLTMTKKETWRAEDELRHKGAMSELAATGYVVEKRRTAKRSEPGAQGRTRRKGKSG